MTKEKFSKKTIWKWIKDEILQFMDFTGNMLNFWFPPVQNEFDEDNEDHKDKNHKKEIK
jgi:hypothetical protein